MGHTDYERTSGEWSRSVAAGSEGGVRKAGHPPPKPRGGWRCPSFSLMHQACAWAGLLPPRGTSPFRTPARDLAAGAVAARRAGREEGILAWFSHSRACPMAVTTPAAPSAHNPNQVAKPRSPAPGRKSSTWRPGLGAGEPGPVRRPSPAVAGGQPVLSRGPAACQHTWGPTSPPQPGTCSNCRPGGMGA